VDVRAARDAAGGPAGRPWLTRNVKVLSGVSLAQDAASELMYPLLPILLTSVLGAPAAVVGIVEGVAEGVAAALKYISGRVSDRVGRRPAILTGYGLAALGKVMVAAAMTWPMVLGGRVVDRFGKGIRGAPRDALLAEGVPASALGKAFGFHRAADTVGAVVGPLVGLAILTATGGNIGAALWIAVIPAVLSVGLILLVREPPRRGTARHGAPEVPAADRRTAALPGRVRVLAAVLGVFALVNFPDALLLLRLTEVGFTAAELMAAYALFNLANAAIAYPAGALSDRWPRSRVYAVGLACFAVGYLGLGLTDQPLAMVLLLLVYGGFAGITEGVGRAWISALTPRQVRGHAQGLYQGLAGVGILVAGLWAGLLWEVGPGGGIVPLVISGCVAALAALGLAAFGGRLEPRSGSGGSPGRLSA
jgi:MFS family permease